MFSGRFSRVLAGLRPPHRRGSCGVFFFEIKPGTREISLIWRPVPGTRYAPRGLLFGPCRRRGPWRAHGANPATRPDAARQSQWHSALQCHRMAFEFGSLLIFTQCSADNVNGLTCYGQSRARARLKARATIGAMVRARVRDRGTARFS